MTGVFVLSGITVVFLKLVSYVHFWHDVKLFILKRKNLIKSDAQSQKLQKYVYSEIEEVIEQYPQNIHFYNLIKFLCLPVLCYQYKYPTTHRIRKTAVINYSLQFIGCILLLM